MYRVLLCSLAVLIAISTSSPHGNWGHHHSWSHPHHEWGHHHNWSHPYHEWGHRHHNWTQHHHPGCGHNHSDGEPNLFDDFAGELIRFDRKAQTFCNTQYVINEYYNRDFYELVGTFKEFTEKDFTIKIKHRALNIIAKKGDLKYSTLIVLPKVANTKQATWSFSDEELNINFPYTFGQQIETVNYCNSVIDESVITVPKVDPPVTSGFDFRADE